MAGPPWGGGPQHPASQPASHGVGDEAEGPDMSPTSQGAGQGPPQEQAARCRTVVSSGPLPVRVLFDPGCVIYTLHYESASSAFEYDQNLVDELDELKNTQVPFLDLYWKY